MFSIKEDERLSKLNHSCAHLLAQAVKHLYPHAKFWVGPVIEEGFYYDIDLGEDVIKDEEGMQTMRILGKNMAYYLKCIEAGKEKGIKLPEQEKTKFTNFIR